MHLVFVEVILYSRCSLFSRYVFILFCKLSFYSLDVGLGRTNICSFYSSPAYLVFVLFCHIQDDTGKKNSVSGGFPLRFYFQIFIALGLMFVSQHILH